MIEHANLFGWPWQVILLTGRCCVGTRERRTWFSTKAGTIPAICQSLNIIAWSIMKYHEISWSVTKWWKKDTTIYNHILKHGWIFSLSGWGWISPERCVLGQEGIRVMSSRIFRVRSSGHPQMCDFWQVYSCHVISVPLLLISMSHHFAMNAKSSFAGLGLDWASSSLILGFLSSGFFVSFSVNRWQGQRGQHHHLSESQWQSFHDERWRHYEEKSESNHSMQACAQDI